MARGVTLLAAWPITQWVLHGDRFIDTYYMQQMVKRTGFIIERSQRHDLSYYFWTLWDSWGLLSLASPIAILLVFGNRTLRRNRDLLSVAFLALIIFVFISAMAFRSERYTAYVVPMLSVVIAHGLTSFLSGYRLLLSVIILTIPCLNWLPDIFRSSHFDRHPDAVSIARGVGARLRDDEQAVFIQAPASSIRVRVELLLYYGDLQKPAYQIQEAPENRRIERLPAAPKGYRGMVQRRCWPLVAGYFPDATKEEIHGEFIHWYASTVDRTAEEKWLIECK